MRKLTKRQEGLLAIVRENPGLNTHRLAQLCGHRQAYESCLRDRLFTLAERGLVQAVEKKGAYERWVVERRWYPVNSEPPPQEAKS
jgi:hypothetical protein